MQIRAGELFSDDVDRDHYHDTLGNDPYKSNFYMLGGIPFWLGIGNPFSVDTFKLPVNLGSSRLYLGVFFKFFRL